jgi:hypothetical protein
MISSTGAVTLIKYDMEFLDRLNNKQSEETRKLKIISTINPCNHTD